MNDVDLQILEDNLANISLCDIEEEMVSKIYCMSSNNKKLRLSLKLFVGSFSIAMSVTEIVQIKSLPSFPENHIIYTGVIK